MYKTDALEAVTSRPKRRHAKGFSLIEVMISSTLFLVAVAGTLSSYNTLSNQRAHQRHMVHALLIAEAHIEESLIHLKTDPMLAPGTTTPSIAFYDGKGKRTPVSSFFEVDISSEDHAVVSEVIVVTIKVRWTERGVAREFSLKTERA